MEDNVYAPPQASLITDSQETQPFYVVSIRKFWFLFLLTLGMYQLYWFYAHWKQYRQATQESLWPAPRAIFSIFFTHALFSKIHTAAQQKNTAFSDTLKGFATMYVVFVIITNLSDRILIESIGEIASVIPFVALPLVGYPLAKAQAYANVACDDADGSTNSTFTAANYVWMVIGGILGILILIGAFAIATGV